MLNKLNWFNMLLLFLLSEKKLILYSLIVCCFEEDNILFTIDIILSLNCFKEAIAVAKKNTYEGSASIHVKLWKEEI